MNTTLTARQRANRPTKYASKDARTRALRLIFGSPANFGPATQARDLADFGSLGRRIPNTWEDRQAWRQSRDLVEALLRNSTPTGWEQQYRDELLQRMDSFQPRS